MGDGKAITLRRMGHKARIAPPPADPYRPAQPHGDIEEVFPDVFFVTGTTTPVFQGERWQYSRNMTVVRHETSLTLINTVRLDDAGLAALERLGTVENVVKLGGFHGIDDAFYVDRYGATLWGLPGAEHESGKQSDRFLGEDAPFPRGLARMPRGLASLPGCSPLMQMAKPLHSGAWATNRAQPHRSPTRTVRRSPTANSKKCFPMSSSSPAPRRRYSKDRPGSTAAT